MKTVKQVIEVAKEAGYTQLPEGKDLPEQLTQLLTDSNAGKYGQYFNDLVFYNGDIETTKEWVIVFDDGGFYKVGADTMVWRYNSEYDSMVARARWSTESLFNGLSEYFTSGQISTDPEYQT